MARPDGGDRRCSIRCSRRSRISPPRHRQGIAEERQPSTGQSRASPRKPTPARSSSPNERVSPALVSRSTPEKSAPWRRSRAKPSLLFGNRVLSARCAASKPTGKSNVWPTGPPFTEKNGEIGIHSISSRRPSSVKIACLGSLRVVRIGRLMQGRLDRQRARLESRGSPADAVVDARWRRHCGPTWREGPPQ